MWEKRSSKRIPVKLRLEISSLFNQDNEKVDIGKTEIEVINVSRTGIAFITDGMLPTGFYFNACLNLGNSDANLFCVVKIIRSEFAGGISTIYGCEFVGLAPVFSYIFDNIEEEFEHEQTTATDEFRDGNR